MTLATTHLGALKTLPERDVGIVNASLQFDAETIRPTYRFEKGVPGRSYGLAIAQRLGIELTAPDQPSSSWVQKYSMVFCAQVRQ
jgi:dsDNA-specific endonuclease/ATPase MutS2